MKRTYANGRAAIVMDLGSAVAKCGFAGEGTPRVLCPVPEAVRALPQSEELALAAVTAFVRQLLFRELHTPAAGRVVAVCRNVHHKDDRLALLVRRALIEGFRAKEVPLHCGQVSALYPTGVLTGLVLDCGSTETRCCPVVHGHALHQWAVNVPLGASAVFAALAEALPQSDRHTEVEAAFVLWSERQPTLDSATFGPVAEAALRRALFDPEEHLENWTVASCLLECLLRCDCVVRPLVVENVVLSGAVADAPRFREVFVAAVLSAVADNVAYAKLRPVASRLMLAAPRFPAATLPWVGTSIVHAVLSTTALTHASPAKQSAGSGR